MKKAFTTPTSLDRELKPSPVMKESVTAVEKIVGYSFKNKRLLEEALTHSSFPWSTSYQRLEVLGDSVLNHAVTNYFFCMADRRKFNQDQITKLRSANAGNLKLARVAVRLGLYPYLRRFNTPVLDDKVKEFIEAVINGEDETGLVHKVLADIVESVAAAIYIDLKFDLDKLWMIFKPLLEPIYTLEDLRGRPMAILYDFCLKNGRRLEIKLKPRDETENISIAGVYVDDVLVGSGSSKGNSNARQNAAKEAVHKLSQSMVVNDGSFEGIPAGNNRSFRIEEAIQMLHVLCAKKRLPKPPEYKEFVLGPPHERKYLYSVKVVTSDGTVKSETGDEKSRKKYAMNSAAYKMFLALQEYYNMINTIKSCRMINRKEADNMIDTKDTDRMINPKEAYRMIKTKESDCMIKTKESDSMLDYIDSLLDTLGAKAYGIAWSKNCISVYMFVFFLVNCTHHQSHGLASITRNETIGVNRGANPGLQEAPRRSSDYTESALYQRLEFIGGDAISKIRGLVELIVTLEDLQDEPRPVTMLFDLCQKHGKHVDIKHIGEMRPRVLLVLSQLMMNGSCEGIVGMNGSFHIEEAKQKLHELRDKRKCIEKDEGPSHDEKRFVSSVKITTMDGVL
ncbi:unnamed protein product [Prunus armeniaca]|uniref:RNase III domain-containing protein n=1 Tax=Prunus armeniaca TaxID=36596 RepID=A0A6J5UQ72_PRUAR|nr:unnamed protein product [Prunus armeniaca]